MINWPFATIFSSSRRLCIWQPATIDPTNDLFTRYPLQLCDTRQLGMGILFDTSTNDQQWESDPRPQWTLSPTSYIYPFPLFFITPLPPPQYNAEKKSWGSGGDQNLPSSLSQLVQPCLRDPIVYTVISLLPECCSNHVCFIHQLAKHVKQMQQRIIHLIHSW